MRVSAWGSPALSTFDPLAESLCLEYLTCVTRGWAMDEIVPRVCFLSAVMIFDLLVCDYGLLFFEPTIQVLI